MGKRMSDASDLLDMMKNPANKRLIQNTLKTKFEDLFKKRNTFYNSPRFDEITDIVLNSFLIV